VSDFEEPTRVTTVGPNRTEPASLKGTDCIVVIYTKQPTLLGKRFPLENSPTRVGRGADNQIVLDGDSVSRRHAQFDRQGEGWFVSDVGSTNGTYCNDDQIQKETELKNGDRVKVGPTIFKFLSGADVEAQYHEEIYRLTIIDGLTQAYNARYLYEALEREIIASGQQPKRAQQALAADRSTNTDDRNLAQPASKRARLAQAINLQKGDHERVVQHIFCVL